MILESLLLEWSTFLLTVTQIGDCTGWVLGLALEALPVEVPRATLYILIGY